jgi:hypothetical protein
MSLFRLRVAVLFIVVVAPVLAQSPPSAPATAPAPAADGDSPAKAGTPFALFLADLRKGDANAAFARLDKLSEDDPEFLPTLTDAGMLLAENKMFTRAIPLVDRAYRKAPDDMTVVHGYIRVHLLAKDALSEPIRPRPRVQSVPAEFRFITDPLKVTDRSKVFPRAALLADLDLLEVLLANAYSYADRRGVNWRGALDALRASLAEGTPVNTFKLRLRRFLTLFGDPHTAVRSSLSGLLPQGGAPFYLVPDGPKVLAIQPTREGFLDPECRYIQALDGIPLSNWLRVAAFDVPKASPQWQRRETVSGLAELASLRVQLGLPATNDVRVTLTSRDGAKRKELLARFSSKPLHWGHWPRAESRQLDDGIGYLRIVMMDSSKAFLDKLDDEMSQFRETRGLIVDVRGNSGGSQDAVKTLLPYFLDPKPNSSMRIINVAAYRLPVKLPQPCAEGYLGMGGRDLFPATAHAWTPAERQEIESFLRGFKPSWTPPPGKFSDWHVMGIRAGSNPRAFHYSKPVVVLMDAGCFSATDNFLGALQGLPNVTLLGTASGGGSGRMANFSLPNTRLALTVCQMASYRANGDLFDGRGVAPDVVLEPQPEDFLKGSEDSVLNAAITRIKRK